MEIILSGQLSVTRFILFRAAGMQREKYRKILIDKHAEDVKLKIFISSAVIFSVEF